MDQLIALKLQESAGYKCVDYLNLLAENNIDAQEIEAEQISNEKNRSLHEIFADDAIFGPVNETELHTMCKVMPSPSSTMSIDHDKSFSITRFNVENAKEEIPRASHISSSEEMLSLRYQMCQWSYQVADSYSVDRDVVSIAFSYADRYCARSFNCVSFSKENYVLVCMTSLYIAIKITASAGKALPISSFVTMSREVFQEMEFISMEHEILSTLQWRMNPPTASLFLNLYFEVMLTLREKDERRKVLLRKCRQLTDLTVHNYYFIPYCPSSIAAASILIAISEGLETRILTNEEYDKLCSSLVDFVDEDLSRLCERLSMAHKRSESPRFQR